MYFNVWDRVPTKYDDVLCEGLLRRKMYDLLHVVLGRNDEPTQKRLALRTLAASLRDTTGGCGLAMELADRYRLSTEEVRKEVGVITSEAGIVLCAFAKWLGERARGGAELDLSMVRSS